jgi:hypothetical protein
MTNMKLIMKPVASDVLLKAVRDELNNATDDVHVECASSIAVPPCDPRPA